MAISGSWAKSFRYLIAAICGAIALFLAENLLPDDSPRLQNPVPHQYGVTDAQFLQTMSGLTGGQSHEGHSLQTLVNGDQIFPSMLEAIKGAKSTINFETYIYWSGEIGRKFAEALAAKSREGVSVRVLVDWAGSIPFDQKLIDTMVQAGVHFHRFRPIRWYTLDRVNNRTHRKLLIVDAAVGFTGGVGIADHWLGDARNPNEWRDTHYRIVGPALTAMQAAFAKNWLEATGEVLAGAEVYPLQEAVGPHGAHLIVSSQPEGGGTLHVMMLMAIAAAESHIRIGTAYFVPDDTIIAQLVEARQRGVEVEIVVPNHLTDVPIVRKGSRHFWGDLLQAGVRIYEYQPTMYHPKLMIVDESWVTVGSANLDERSLKLNDEANLNVYGKEFAVEQAEIFQEGLSRSKQMTLAEWQSRPLKQKITDWLASLLRSQL